MCISAVTSPVASVSTYQSVPLGLLSILFGVATFTGLVLLALLTTPKGRGWLGEWWVKVYLRRLDAAVYHCLHDLLIPDGKGGWAQLDHVVVSPFGFFVIETKNHRGWIFGTEEQAQWTVSYHKNSKRRFLNPLRQNAGHIAALERLPGFPAGKCHNIVFLAGSGQLKTSPVSGVVESRLARHILSFQTPLLTPAEAAAWAERLQAASRSHDRVARQQHRTQARLAGGRR